MQKSIAQIRVHKRRSVELANYTTNKNNFGLHSIRIEIFMQNFVFFMLAQSRSMRCLWQ